MAKKIFGSLELRTQSSILFTDADSSNSVAIKSPATVSSDLTLTLPASVSVDSILSSDASGNLSAIKIANANVDASAAIAYSKLDLSGSIVNADINASAAIDYSKLDLADDIVNADINSAAAIAFSKMEDLTTARALVSDGSGDVSVSAVTATELGYVSGVTSAIQTQLDNKLEASDITGKASTALDNLTVGSLAAESLLIGSSSSAVSALGVGSNGQVLKVVAGSIAWAADAGSSSFSADWALADGTTKTITHNLGTKDVIVQLYNKADDATIEVDSAVRTDTNTVDLTASEAPNASGWRVLILSA